MTGKLIEIAYVVDDLDAAIRSWTRDLGVGPFSSGVFEVPDQDYRGTRATARMNVAFGFSNGVLIELIQPLASAPCIFSEAGPGFHHMMFEVPDHDAEVARLTGLGFAVVQSGLFGGASFSIVDTRPATGAFTEVMAFGEGLRGLYGRMRDASEGWDGSDPHRDLFAAA